MEEAQEKGSSGGKEGKLLTTLHRAQRLQQQQQQQQRAFPAIEFNHQPTIHQPIVANSDLIGRLQ